MKRLKQLVKISLRNVFRNKRRTILTLFILILGSNGLILVGGFFDNIMEGLREQFIHSQTGHLQVNVTGYYKKGTARPFQYMLKNTAQVQQEIEAVPHVLYTVPRLKFGGMASSEETGFAVFVLGVDPVRERQMGNLQYRDAKYPSIHIAEGEDLDPADPYGAILGKGLMEALDLKVGDSLTLLVTREGGALDGADYQVRGNFETIFKDFDDRVMKVNLNNAQELLGVPNQVHSLLVVLDETKNTSGVYQQLVARFKGKGLDLETIPWEEQGTFYRQSKALMDKIYATIQVIISVIFFFSIANTINMAIFERIREFGTMMALGNSRATIATTIFLEALSLGLLGASLGLLTGIGLAKLVSFIGIEMPPPPMGSYGYYAMISLSPRLLLETFFITLIATLLSSVVPAYRVCHFKIVQALGYV